MSDQAQPKTHPASDAFVATAHVDAARYDAMYAASIKDPEGFWAGQGQRVDWIAPFT